MKLGIALTIAGSLTCGALLLVFSMMVYEPGGFQPYLAWTVVILLSVFALLGVLPVLLGIRKTLKHGGPKYEKPN